MSKKYVYIVCVLVLLVLFFAVYPSETRFVHPHPHSHPHAHSNPHEHVVLERASNALDSDSAQERIIYNADADLGDHQEANFEQKSIDENSLLVPDDIGIHEEESYALSISEEIYDDGNMDLDGIPTWQVDHGKMYKNTLKKAFGFEQGKAVDMELFGNTYESHVRKSDEFMVDYRFVVIDLGGAKNDFVSITSNRDMNVFRGEMYINGEHYQLSGNPDNLVLYNMHELDNSMH